ncbi:hypothetical protein [Rudaeicoccus suwonensis]|uniref:hypothetical protein n=1 Tax=Rudaeicoccus suwonensis TaxID=657409 RepID=UPI001BA7F634|nr:hypothetical protein [Rudaeicoccus suwonensis]
MTAGAAAVVIVAAVVVAGMHGSSRPTVVAAPETSTQQTVTVTSTVPPPTDPSSGPSPSDSDSSDLSTASSAAGSSDSDSDSASDALSDAEALAQLQSDRSTDLAEISLDGDWDAQVASQYVGVVDSSIQPGPMSATDILNYSNSFADNPSYGSLVRVVAQNDFGQISSDPRQVWITLVDLQATTESAVQSWCEANFPQRGTALEEKCVPRQMLPPYQ